MQPVPAGVARLGTFAGVFTPSILAIVSFLVGGVLHWVPGRIAANWTASADALPFWTLFAMFFPAVTGFTQGVSMSGELADPGRSLPAGTFPAVGLSTVVYLIVMLLLAGAEDARTLASDYTVMRRTTAVGGLVDAGILAVTLSSALASFLGAPRILHAVASDRIFRVLAPFASRTLATAPPPRSPVRGIGDERSAITRAGARAWPRDPHRYTLGVISRRCEAIEPAAASWRRFPCWRPFARATLCARFSRSSSPAPPS